LVKQFAKTTKAMPEPGTDMLTAGNSSQQWL